MTTERTGVITFKGDGLTLLGDAVEVGQPAPPFTVTGQDLSPITLDDFKGKVLILSIVPSLDTPVCDAQTRRFNEEAATVGDDVAILTVSMDLPMAQKRWCGAAGVERVATASDYKDHGFGVAYGVRIKELGLLARAVIVIDKEGVVRHAEIVSEVTEEPDYAKALQVVKGLAG